MKSCYRYKERICAEEGEDVSLVKRKEKGSARVHIRTSEKRVH